VTEFFGLMGGPSSFSQNFGASTSSAQNCPRLPVDSLSPGG
jgi:hypothetical protein